MVVLVLTAVILAVFYNDLKQRIIVLTGRNVMPPATSYADIRKPISSLELLNNIKIVMNRNYPLARNFLNESTVHQFINIQTMSQGIIGDNHMMSWASSTDFGDIFLDTLTNKKRMKGLLFNATYKQNMFGHLIVAGHFQFQSGGPRFKDVEDILGNDWKIDRSLQYFDNGPPRPTAPHGNERLIYYLGGDPIRRILAVRFSSDGSLFLVEYYEEVR